MSKRVIRIKRNIKTQNNKIDAIKSHMDNLKIELEAQQSTLLGLEYMLEDTLERGDVPVFLS